MIYIPSHVISRIVCTIQTLKCPQKWAWVHRWMENLNAELSWMFCDHVCVSAVCIVCSSVLFVCANSDRRSTVVFPRRHLYFSTSAVLRIAFRVFCSCAFVSFSLNFPIAADASTNGEATTCGRILIVLSWVLVLCTMPLSLFVCFKVRK